MTVLSTAQIVAGYNTADVLRGVSITVEPGEIVAVLGRNGVGKTSLMRAVIGLLPVRDGRIAFNDVDITTEGADQRARRGIGYVPQGRGIFPQLTVRENLRMGGFINAAQAKPDFDMVFEYFPILKERLGQRGGTLSGGQQAMLAIARALINGPCSCCSTNPATACSPASSRRLAPFSLS